MTTKDELPTEAAIADKPVLPAVFRPKTGHELLLAMQQHKDCEIVNSHAFIAAKLLEEHLQGSFCFKPNKWNKGWAGFSRW